MVENLDLAATNTTDLFDFFTFLVEGGKSLLLMSQGIMFWRLQNVPIAMHALLLEIIVNNMDSHSFWKPQPALKSGFQGTLWRGAIVPFLSTQSSEKVLFLSMCWPCAEMVHDVTWP